MPLIDNSNLAQALTEFKNKLSTPAYVDPMNVKGEHIVEYASLNMSESQALAVNTKSTKVKINFNTDVNSNMPIDTTNCTIHLTAGKTYRIFVSLILSSGASRIGYILANYSNLNSINGVFGMAVSSNYNEAFSDTPLDCIYTPSTDMDICIIVDYNPVATTVLNGFSKFLVQEIAQSVVVEYNKEISNPLTLESASQETPVGTVIDYIGSENPLHYLKCDGNIYNIADYPHLSDFIKNKFGSYNYYGGDGITTFAVPSILEDIKTSLVPTMTSNTSPSGTAIASGVYGGGTIYAYPAFDNSDSFWASNNSGAKYIGYQFLSSKIVNYYSIKIRVDDLSASVPQAPTTWTFEGFNGTSWVVIDTLNNISWIAGETKFFSSRNTTAYISYRLQFTTGTAIISLASVQFYNKYSSKYIKYEPTFIAVNQYGGFDEIVLWEGSSIPNTANTLAESILNYNYLVIEWHSRVSSGSYRIGRPIIISVADIKYKTVIGNTTVSSGDGLYLASEMNVSNTGVTSGSICLQVAFITNLIFVQNGDGTVYGWDTAPSVVKVIGVKGQLPSLLTGGEF